MRNLLTDRDAVLLDMAQVEATQFYSLSADEAALNWLEYSLSSENECSLASVERYLKHTKPF